MIASKLQDFQNMKGSSSRWKSNHFDKINEKVACLIEKVLFWDAQQKVHSERFSKAVLLPTFLIQVEKWELSNITCEEASSQVLNFYDRWVSCPLFKSVAQILRQEFLSRGDKETFYKPARSDKYVNGPMIFWKWKLDNWRGCVSQSPFSSNIMSK